MDISINDLFIPACLSLAIALFFLYRRMKNSRIKNQWATFTPQASKISASEMEALEKSIGGTLPQALRTAYLTGTIASLPFPITLQQQKDTYRIVDFLAADPLSNADLTVSTEIGPNTFIFASDDFGNYFFTRPNSPGVWYINHDGGDISDVSAFFPPLWAMLQQ